MPSIIDYYLTNILLSEGYLPACSAQLVLNKSGIFHFKAPGIDWFQYYSDN